MMKKLEFTRFTLVCYSTSSGDDSPLPLTIVIRAALCIRLKACVLCFIAWGMVQYVRLWFLLAFWID